MPLKKKLKNIAASVILGLLSIAFLFPLILTISDSFMTEDEIDANYGMVASESSSNQTFTMGSSVSRTVASEVQYANLKFISDIVTFEQYYNVLVKRTKFLVMFWNSVKLVLPIVFGQVAVASLAAYAFAKINFIWREKLFFVYIIVMLMPFQVTLVPNYIIADKIGLTGNVLSIILPGIFTTFGVFLLRQFMLHIPDEYSEAARVDGASHWLIFSRVILPMAGTGLAALMILAFIDNWNMVEQPLIFLKDVNLQPLSTFLANINEGERGIAFAASTIYMLPMLLVFLYWENYLIEGIQLSGLKG